MQLQLKLSWDSLRGLWGVSEVMVDGMLAALIDMHAWQGRSLRVNGGGTPARL